jgi:hypothetical protein
MLSQRSCDPGRFRDALAARGSAATDIFWLSQ